jgi:hypothetical protein
MDEILLQLKLKTTFNAGTSAHRYIGTSADFQSRRVFAMKVETVVQSIPFSAWKNDTK